VFAAEQAELSTSEATMRSKLTFQLLLFTLLILLLGGACIPTPTPTPAPNCSVPEYTVTKTADTNDGLCDAIDCSLREAVHNANVCIGAKTIHLPAGHYPLTLTGVGEDANATGDLDITDDLKILGDGVPSISGENQDRIFEIFHPAVVELDLLILINGNEQLGGAVHNRSTTTIRRSSIHDNVAEVPPGGSGTSSGGGIFNGAGTLTLIDTQVFGNVADHGGGIHNFATADLIAEDVLLQGNRGNENAGGLWNNFAATATLDNVEIRDNETINFGAGIYNAGQLNANWVTLAENTSGLDGGGLWNKLDADAMLTNVDIRENSATNLGAGIYNAGLLEATGATLVENAAAQDGGGLWNNLAAVATLTNVEIRDNDAVNHGAGVYNAGQMDANWVTLVGNVAGLNGGGLWVGPDGATYLYDVWLTNNNAAAGGGAYNQGLTHLYRSSVTNNTALGGLGGGAYNDVTGLFLLQNTTVSTNMIDAPPGLPGGSGVFNIGDMRLEFVTVAHNNRDGLRNDAGGMMTIRSSLVAYHAHGNCTGMTPMNPSIGFNIEDQDTCDLIESSDLVNTDPLLAVLASNGGNGLSHMPNPGSLAIDSGDPDKCNAEDQRSVSRPQGTDCDRGSIEVEATTPIPTPTPPPPTLGTVTGAVCYPSEGIPPMDLYFLEVGTQVVSSFPHTDGSTSYSVDLDPGTYVAYAYPVGYDIGGSYSEAVLCGLTVNCTDHTLIEFDVFAGQETSDIDICDWYGESSGVPLPSGEMPASPMTATGFFIMDAFCRKGPGTEYGTAAGYEAGQEVELIGRSEPGRPPWWKTILRCWVSDSTVETRGPVMELAIYPAPALPEPVSPPDAPARLRLSEVVCNEKQYRISINWLDQADNEDGYRVYRDGGLLATLGANANSYTDNPPKPGPHTYEIEAYNEGGSSGRVSVEDKGCTQ
jgi:CSLREA domain-containing protein